MVTCCIRHNSSVCIVLILVIAGVRVWLLPKIAICVPLRQECHKWINELEISVGLHSPPQKRVSGLDSTSHSPPRRGPRALPWHHAQRRGESLGPYPELTLNPERGPRALSFPDIRNYEISPWSPRHRLSVEILAFTGHSLTTGFPRSRR